MGGWQGYGLWRDEGGAGGFFFISVLFLIAFLGMLISVNLTRATTERAAASRFADHEQAFQLAEAGIDDALMILNTSSLEWSDELAGLAGYDGIAGTSDDVLLTSEPTDFGPDTTYAVRLFDNTDEVAPATDNPTVDADGIIRIVSTGTVRQSQRRLDVSLWALFNHAIAAQTYIRLRQTNALGSLHANGDILVSQPSTLFGCAQATASGIVDQSQASLVYDPLCSTVASGVPPITFPRPDEQALRAAVTRWDAANWKATIVLFNNDVIGYERQLSSPPNAPQTVSLASADKATIVMFDGNSIRFRQSLGTFSAPGVCQTFVNLSVIALGGGSIEFEQPVCLRGLLWAEGSITIAQDSSISGAVVSAGSFVDVKQSSSISYNRSVISSSLLPGFSGSTVLSWQEL